MRVRVCVCSRDPCEIPAVDRFFCLDAASGLLATQRVGAGTFRSVLRLCGVSIWLYLDAEVMVLPPVFLP